MTSASNASAALTGLLLEMRQHPEAREPALILADWLEEHDDPRAAFLRSWWDPCERVFAANMYGRWQALKAARLLREQRSWLGDLPPTGAVYWEGGLPVLQVGLQSLRDGWPEAVQRHLEQGWLRRIELRVYSDGGARQVAVAASDPAVRQRLRQISGLDLQNCHDEAVQQLAFLSWLERISVAGHPYDPALVQGITAAGLRTLTESGQLAGLRHLRLWLPQLVDPDLHLLEQATQLERLGLLRVPLEGTGLAHLGGCRQLMDLELNEVGLRGAGLSRLPALPRLRRLTLSWTQVEDAQLQNLTRLSSLEELSLWNVRIKGEGLRYLAELPALRSLDLTRTKLQVRPLQHLVAFPSLEALNLAYTPLGPSATRSLGQLTGLRCLDLYGTRLGAADLRPLANLGRLERLRLSHRIPAEALPQLGELTSLRELCMKHMAVSDAHLASLAPLVHLRVLQMEGNDSSWTGTGLGALPQLTNLQELDLSSHPIEDSALAHLAALPGLRCLGLAETRITDAGLAHLASLSRLEFLDLSSTAITSEGLRHLRGLSSLLCVILDYTQVGDVGLAYLRDLPALNTLHLEGTSVTAEGVRSLPASVKVHHDLHE